jgi:hypothetical protein
LRAPIPVRVVVVTTFEPGEDTGDVPGEFQFWVERLPLPRRCRFRKAIGICDTTQRAACSGS